MNTAKWTTWLSVLLIAATAGWMVFDGTRALIVGDYFTQQNGEFAGQLGPWSYLVQAIGLDPRSVWMKLLFITQDDVIHRHVFDPTHRSFVKNFGSFIKSEEEGKMKYYAVTRQMVLFAIERRKAWRMLQSKAGVVNKDYAAQKAFLAKLDKGEVSLVEAKARARELITAEFAAVK